MRSLFIASVLAVSITPGASWAQAESLTVDQVVERYVAAIGGTENIKAIRNLVYGGGVYEEGDYTGEGGATMSLARPFFKLVGNQDEPGGYMEGYDGAAWEWFADPGIVVRTVGAASGAIRHYAGVDHPLVDSRAKGSTATIKGETVLDDRPVVLIELIRRDGFLEQFYIDKESWLIVASSSTAPIHAFGDEVFSLTRISDYRPVAGVQIAHRFASLEMPSGKEQGSMQWGSIEANHDLSDGWFSPPSFERTPLQLFIEHLYQQRSDIESVMWTYHEFRRAYPDMDTSDAVNVAGYQILKMGVVDQAIALLQQNVRDYPEAPNSRFGLGRALRTAGRLKEARAEFEQTLMVDPEHDRAKAALEGMDRTNR